MSKSYAKFQEGRIEDAGSATDITTLLLGSPPDTFDLHDDGTLPSADANVTQPEAHPNITDAFVPLDDNSSFLQHSGVGNSVRDSAAEDRDSSATYVVMTSADHSIVLASHSEAPWVFSTKVMATDQTERGFTEAGASVFPVTAGHTPDIAQLTVSEDVLSADAIVVGMQGLSFATNDNGDSYPQASAGTAGSSSTNAAKPVGTIPQLADYLLNGFWQYAGEISHHWAITTIAYNINGLTTAEKALAQSALEAWHEVTNLNFVQTAGAANITYNHSGTMTAFESDSYNGSGIMSSATIDISADWITTDGGANDHKTGIDSYGYQTYLHETGHALGLGHQGPYNGSASYSTNAIYADDTWQYSIMSYFDQSNYNGGSYRYVITPELADIYAVDSIYGAATTRAGNTVYGFHDTAGSIFDFAAYTQAPALTIYDSGGNDTLDCSGYSSAQAIDLHPGSFSSIGGLVDNIGIATNATIEIAIGGSGNDTLLASDSGSTLKGGGGNDTLIGGAGADTLVGGAGVDSLTGGAGADIFAFATGDSSASSGQHDLITDFLSGTDKIDLTGIDADTSTSGIVDAFRFIATAAFDGFAAALDYFFDSILPCIFKMPYINEFLFALGDMGTQIIKLLFGRLELRHFFKVSFH